MPFELRNVNLHSMDEARTQGTKLLVHLYRRFLIASTSPKKHLQRLRMVLEWSEKYREVINVSKSHFGVFELYVIGYHIVTIGIRPLEEKIRSSPIHPHKASCGSFFGLVNLFIPQCATTLQPLNALLKHTNNPTNPLIAWSGPTQPL